MIHKLVHALLLLLLVGCSINAQQRNDSFIQQRARNLEPYFVESANRYGIDPRILRVLCYLESRFRLDAISPKGARGPMQFMPETAARYGLTNPHDPKAAIDAAARYIRHLLRRFDGGIHLAFAAYNAGEGTVEAFRNGHALQLKNGRVINAAQLITGGIPPYSETRNYVRLAMRLLNDKGPNRLAPGGSMTDVSIHSTRDFTIDVSANENDSQLSPRERQKWFFIEIQ